MILILLHTLLSLAFSVYWNEYYTLVPYSTYSEITLPDCSTVPRILDPSNPFYNLYLHGFSYTQNEVSAWEEMVQKIDTLDLNEPNGMQA